MSFLCFFSPFFSLIWLLSYDLLLYIRINEKWLCWVVHFWAPTFKWGISIANIADFAKPPENLSYPQQIAVTATGVIWSRYSTVINPKNWNLFSVNVAMAGTGIYQLSRKIKHDYFSEEQGAVAKEWSQKVSAEEWWRKLQALYCLNFWLVQDVKFETLSPEFHFAIEIG